MKPYICYKIIPEKKLVLEYFCGHLSWKDLMENKKKLALDKNYDSTFNIIDDVRDAFIVFDEEGLSKFVKLINETNKLQGKRKTAILTDTPNQLVNSELLNSRKKEVPFSLKTVSTLLTATKWVNASSSDFELIEDSLAELKNIAKNL